MMKHSFLSLLPLMLLVACSRAPKVAESVPTDTPPRILSFAPAATESLFFVGLGPYVVGRSPFCDTPEDARTLPVVGDMRSFDEAAIVSTKATHAIVSSDSNSVVPFLESLGVQVIRSTSLTDTDVIDFLRVLGETFPAYTNGVYDAWLAEYRSLDVRAPAGLRAALILDTPEGPRQDCMAAGCRSYYDALLSQVGLENLYADFNGFASVSPEALLAKHPDVLFVVGFDRDADAIASDWGAWMGTATRVVPLCESWAFRPGPRMTELKKAMLQAAARY